MPDYDYRVLLDRTDAEEPTMLVEVVVGGSKVDMLGRLRPATNKGGMARRRYATNWPCHYDPAGTLRLGEETTAQLADDLRSQMQQEGSP